MKILSFSQQESRAICVLSASGSISNVTLRQPNSSGGTLTYEVCLLNLVLTFDVVPLSFVSSVGGGRGSKIACWGLYISHGMCKVIESKRNIIRQFISQ